MATGMELLANARDSVIMPDLNQLGLPRAVDEVEFKLGRLQTDGHTNNGVYKATSAT